jgi:hypothetical protein
MASASGIMDGTGYFARRAFRCASYQSIADELNKREIKPSRAEKWNASSVKAVLDSRMQSEAG